MHRNTRRVMAAWTATTVLSFGSHTLPGWQSRAAAATGAAKDATSPSRPDQVSAALAAKAAGQPVEVTGATTETLRRWANPDGTVTDELSVAPVRTRNGTDWIDIDTTLALRDGAIRPNATLGDVRFTAGGAGPLASVAHSGVGVSLGWRGILPPPELAGNTARYPDVLPDIDLELSAMRAGFEQSFVLKSPAATLNAATMRLPLSAQGAVPRTSRGAIAFVGADGVERAWIGAARMWDAAGREAPVGVRLVRTVAGDELELTPDAAFLADPSVKYPVTVDPTVQIYKWRDAYINSGASTTNYGSNAYLKAGTRLTSQYVSYIEFPLKAYSDKYIVDVTQYLGTVDSVTCAAKTTSLYLVTTEWYESQITWNNRPSTQLSADGLLAQATTAGGGPVGSTCQPNAWMTFNDARLTSRFRYWSTNDADNFGMSIRVDSSDLQAAKDFASGENTSWTPRANITYNHIPSTPTHRAQSPSSVHVSPAGTRTTYVTTRTPTLSATSSDVDGGVLEMNFSLWNEAETQFIDIGIADGVPAGTPGTWKVPSGSALADGNYKWKSFADDGTSTSAYSGWTPFTVDATPPGALSVSSAEYPADTWTPGAGTGTFAWTGAPADTDHYLWGVDTEAPTTTVRTASVQLDPVPDGWTTFVVRAVDKAGNLGPIAEYRFGAGPQVTSPVDGEKTQASVLLAARTRSGESAVTYEYRGSGADSWDDIPAPDVTYASTSAGIGSWPVTWTQGTGDSTPPVLVWDVAQTLSGTDGAVEVRACFGTTAPSCSAEHISVTLDQNAFGASYALEEVGPGRVSLLTGNYSVTATDVVVPSFASQISFTRTFNSRTPLDPQGGVLGDGWTSSVVVPEAGPYVELADAGETVTLTTSDGSLVVFARTAAGGYEGVAEAGATGFVLAPVNVGLNGPASFELRDSDGNLTTFTPAAPLDAPASPGSPHAYRVSAVSEAGSARHTTYTYSGSRVSRVLAPVPAGSVCTDAAVAAEWTAGCRALLFTYTPGGRLTAITLATADPSSGAPLRVDVACYSYTGAKLAISWDPREAAAGTGPYPVQCATPARPTTYEYDSAGRLQAITPPGLRPYVFTYDGDGRLTTFTRQHAAPWGSDTEATSIKYGVPLTSDSQHPEYRPTMTAAAVAEWSQTDSPVTASAIFEPGDAVSATDFRDADLVYLDVSGRAVNRASYAGTGAAGWHVDTTEYNAAGDVIRTLSATNRAEALNPTGPAGKRLGLPEDPRAASVMLDERTIYSADGVDVLHTYKPYRRVQFDDGTTGGARQHIRSWYDTGSEPGHPGTPARVPVRVEVSESRAGAADPALTGVETDVRVTTMEYALDATNNEGWLYRRPLRTTTDPDGLNIRVVERFDPATGLQVEAWTPKASDGSTPAADVPRAKIITTRYTSDASSPVLTCRNKPQWTHLPCQVGPGASAAVGPLPGIPITTYEYDYLLRPTVGIDAVTTAAGVTHTRTSTTAFENAGYGIRVASVTLTGGEGPVAPTVTFGYNTATGLLEVASAAPTAELPASTIATTHDDFGRETTYGDADGNTATTTYDSAGRIASIVNAKGSTTFGYGSATDHRGLPTSMTVSGIPGQFTAQYDADGRLTTETFPNGLTREVTFDEAGFTTGLTATTTTGQWWREVVVRGSHGLQRVRAATSSTQTFTYDKADRLTRVEDVVGGTCTTRTYAFDVTSNRTESRSYVAAPGAACQWTTGPVTTQHEYDVADRLKAAFDDAGLGYDAWGRVTTLPSADADGAGSVTLTYFNNDLVRSQEQGARKVLWTLDASLRFRSWTDLNAGVTKTNHYDGPGDSPSWVAENGTATTWTRNVVGFSGTLVATVNDAAAVTYQVTNLHGDVVATASATSGATPDGGYSESDEYGNRRSGSTPRYGWLGGERRSGDALAGTILMGARVYAPRLGRFLQADPVRGGSANAYDYANQDPIAYRDLDGEVPDKDGGGGSRRPGIGVSNGGGGPRGGGATSAPTRPSAPVAATGFSRFVRMALRIAEATRTLHGCSSNCHWHHIVAKSSPRAERARRILRAANIGINESRNLVYLDSRFHQRLHTNAYFAEVNTRIEVAAAGNATGNRNQILNTLYYLKANLMYAGGCSWYY